MGPLEHKAEVIPTRSRRLIALNRISLTDLNVLMREIQYFNLSSVIPTEHGTTTADCVPLAPCFRPHQLWFTQFRHYVPPSPLSPFTPYYLTVSPIQCPKHVSHVSKWQQRASFLLENGLHAKAAVKVNDIHHSWRNTCPILWLEASSTYCLCVDCVHTCAFLLKIIQLLKLGVNGWKSQHHNLTH